MAGLTNDEYVALLRSQSEALAAAAGRDLDAPIAGCPGWSMRDLVSHTGRVQRSVTQIVRTRATEPGDRSSVPSPPDGAAIVDWFREGAADLAGVLAQADPAAPAWHWGPEPHTASFWFRRMAQECAVHRWDAEAAVGDAAPIPTELAVDGVDELLDFVLPRSKGVGPFPEQGLTLHLHATDADGEWLLRMAGDRVDVERGHAKGDAAVRGPASQLLLLLWKRVGADAPGFEVFGDPSVVDRWREQVQL